MTTRTKRVFGPPPMSGTSTILTDQQVNAIRNVTSGSLKEAADRFGVSEATITKIWQNVGRYKNVPLNPRT